MIDGNNALKYEYSYKKPNDSSNKIVILDKKKYLEYLEKRKKQLLKEIILELMQKILGIALLVSTGFIMFSPVMIEAGMNDCTVAFITVPMAIYLIKTETILLTAMY